MHEARSRAPWVRNLVIYAFEKFWSSDDCTPVHTPVQPSVCTTRKPIWNVTFSSWCGSLKHVFNLLIDITYYGQLTAVKSWYQPTRIKWMHCRLRCQLIKVNRCYAFCCPVISNWSQAQVYVFHQLILKSQWPLDLWIYLQWFQVHCLKYFINAETGASLLKLWGNLQDWYTLPYIPQQWLPVHHGQLF